jgi:hypothetical protein
MIIWSNDVGWLYIGAAAALSSSSGSSGGRRVQMMLQVKPPINLKVEAQWPEAKHATQQIIERTRFADSKMRPFVPENGKSMLSFSQEEDAQDDDNGIPEVVAHGEYRNDRRPVDRDQGQPSGEIRTQKSFNDRFLAFDDYRLPQVVQTAQRGIP